MIAKQRKKEIVEQFGGKTANTGSTSAQIALLSERIQELVKHFDKNPKDFGSKRGFLILVGQRRRLLRYLKKSDPKAYAEIAKRTELA
jgi:small subunit ribosomal protein S15